MAVPIPKGQEAGTLYRANYHISVIEPIKSIFGSKNHRLLALNAQGLMQCDWSTPQPAGHFNGTAIACLP